MTNYLEKALRINEDKEVSRTPWKRNKEKKYVKEYTRQYTNGSGMVKETYTGWYGELYDNEGNVVDGFDTGYKGYYQEFQQMLDKMAKHYNIF